MGKRENFHPGDFDFNPALEPRISVARLEATRRTPSTVMSPFAQSRLLGRCATRRQSRTLVARGLVPRLLRRTVPAGR
jgi:hypothetical protein